MSLLLRFLLGHMVGDFVLQTIDLVRYKVASWKGLLIHAAIVVLCTALFLWEYLPAWWPWLLLLFFLHVSTDWAKVSLDRCFPRWGILLFFLDQSLHVGAMFLLLYLGQGEWPYSSLVEAIGGGSVQANRNLLFLLALLTALFIVPIIEIQLSLSLVCRTAAKRSQNGTPALLVDRLCGGAERTMALLLFYLGQPLMWLAPLSFLPRGLILCRRARNSQSPLLCWTKLAISIVCTVLLAGVLWFMWASI
ncbi:MAG: DUF3307 domain-containing protein [Chloroflexia bacterium]|nr:DUF3307 domain-containing protein [Chloroflexia bacterium]